MAKPPDSDKKVSELREDAKAAGITGVSHMRKEELVEALDHNGASQNGLDGEDAIALLVADHRNVKDLFGRVLDKEPGDESMADLAERIITELEAHTQAEEQLFYPALKARAIERDDDEAKEGVVEAYVEHGSVKELISKIRSSSPSDESYKAMLQVMSEQVDHHVEEEEGEMFEQARQLLEPQTLQSLGRKMAELKATRS